MGRPEPSLDLFPSVSADLVEALALRFPDRCPQLTDPEREVWAAVGRAEVVQFLRAQHQEQNETLYEEP